MVTEKVATTRTEDGHK